MAIRPVLGARDVAAAVEWYVSRLGFTCEFDDGDHPVRYAGVRRDLVALHLQWQDDSYFPRPGEDGPMYRIVVDDPDALFTEFSDKSVFHAGTALRDTLWGTREFGIYDPDGNGLVFYRPLN